MQYYLRHQLPPYAAWPAAAGGEQFPQDDAWYPRHQSGRYGNSRLLHHERSCQALQTGSQNPKARQLPLPSHQRYSQRQHPQRNAMGEADGRANAPQA